MCNMAPTWLGQGVWLYGLKDVLIRMDVRYWLQDLWMLNGIRLERMLCCVGELKTEEIRSLKL
jgi:hypothetical protein